MKLKIGDLVEHIHDKNYVGIVTKVTPASTAIDFYSRHNNHQVIRGGNYGSHTVSINTLPIPPHLLKDHPECLGGGWDLPPLLRKIKQLDKKWETHIKAKGPSFVISPVKSVVVKTTTPYTQTGIPTASDVGHTPMERLRRPPSVTRWLEDQGF